MPKKPITEKIRKVIHLAWTDLTPPKITNLEEIKLYCPETEMANLPVIVSAILMCSGAEQTMPEVKARALFTGKNYQQVDTYDSSFLLSYAMNYFEDSVKLHYYAAYMLRTCDAIDNYVIHDDFEDLDLHFITIRELDPMAAIGSPQQKVAIELLKKAIFDFDGYIREDYEEHILKKNLAKEIIQLLYPEWDKLPVPSRLDFENGEILLECSKDEIQIYADKHYRDVDYLDGWFFGGFSMHYMKDNSMFYYYGTQIRMLCNLLETDGAFSQDRFSLKKVLPQIIQLANTTEQQRILKKVQEGIDLL